MAGPKLLDLFCCAGGAGEGYRRAGFDVTGVDHKDQPNNPHRFVKGCAIDFLQENGQYYDVIHASPPCQKYSRSTAKFRREGYEYPDLIGPVRKLLIQSGKPYIIENVPGAPVRPDLKLSGLNFGLRVFRERWFELGGGLLVLNPPKVKTQPGNTVDGNYISVVGKGGHNSGQAKRHEIKFWKGSWKATAAYAMEIEWMTWAEMAQAIPPAYTEYIGNQIRSQIWTKTTSISK